VEGEGKTGGRNEQKGKIDYGGGEGVEIRRAGGRYTMSGRKYTTSGKTVYDEWEKGERDQDKTKQTRT
jgi:hypothetical protein